MAAHCQLDDIRSACQLDCVRLTTDAVHGRILVATRDIDVGEVVLAEKPLLVWQSDGRGPHDAIDFLDAYDEASEETRLAVADFYCPDLDGQMGQVPMYRELSRRLAEDSPLKLRHPLTARDIHRLLMIKVTNAHSYTGTAGAYGEIVAGAGPHVKSAALFEMGSKVSHACQPNTSYSSRHNNGMMTYTAIRPIRTGEMVTFSYIGDVWQTPTAARRDDLRERYGFECQCEHCKAGAASEPCRKLRCPSCNGASLAEFCTTDDGGDRWTCSKCGELGEEKMTRDDERYAHRRWPRPSSRTSAAPAAPP